MPDSLVPTSLLMLQGELSRVTIPSLEALPATGRHVLLDLSYVSFVDAEGLRFLQRYEQRVSASGGRLALVGLAPEPALVFRLLGVDDSLPCFATHNEAQRFLATGPRSHL